MSNSRYYIVGNDDVWMIQFNDNENGQYKGSNRVTSFAITAAQNLGMRGERAHVCVLDDDGRLRCKWTYNTRSQRCDPRSSRVRAAAHKHGTPWSPGRRRRRAQHPDDWHLHLLLRALQAAPCKNRIG
jgi:hypothetical protein